MLLSLSNRSYLDTQVLHILATTGGYVPGRSHTAGWLPNLAHAAEQRQPLSQEKIPGAKRTCNLIAIILESDALAAFSTKADKCLIFFTMHAHVFPVGSATFAIFEEFYRGASRGRTLRTVFRGAERHAASPREEVRKARQYTCRWGF
jgi:hypothetical protein